MLNIKYIESLGFKKRPKDQWIGWKDFIKEIDNPEYEYFHRYTVHIPRMGNQWKIIVHRHLNSKEDNIEGQINYGESEIVYKGLIENEEQLKTIIKYLGLDVQ